MMRTVLTAAALIIGAGAVLAQAGPEQFDGDWTIGNPAACAVGEDSTNFAFRIGGGEFRGLESRCRMTNPVTVRDLGAMLFDMECEGEGDRWSYRNFMMLDREGALVMINDGFVSILSRCEGAAAGGTPAPPSK